MKKKFILKVMCSIITILIITTLMVACANDENKQSETSTGSEVNEPAKSVHLTILVEETGLRWNAYPNNLVAKEIEKQIGVTFEFIEADANRYKVMIAGGDLPDILRVTHGAYGKQLIDGGLIIPLDELLESNGQDIKNNIPTVIDFFKKNNSLDKNKLFYIPVQVSSKESPYFKVDIGATLRWDYYKEIGAPAINNTNDLLDALEKMVELKPTTDTGRKVYGVSFWNDWDAGLWGYNLNTFFQAGDSGSGRGVGMVMSSFDTLEVENIFTNPESGYWTSVDFLYQANKRGLLDPDALTMKFDDFTAKASAGQVLYGPSEWAMGDFNSVNSKDAKGFLTIPVGKYGWFGETSPLGWGDSKWHAISKSSKHPEKAMDLLNYFSSADGSRTMWSGVKGVHWDVENGVAKLKEETIQLQKNGGDEWINTGIQMDANIIGLGRGMIHPVDGQPLSLFETAEVYAERLTNLELDYCQHYGVEYPAQIFENLVKEGKLYNYSSYSSDEKTNMAISLIPGFLGSMPDEIQRIEVTVKDIAVKYAARMILSNSDSKFLELKNQMLNDMGNAGMDQYTEWCTNQWNNAKIEAGKAVGVTLD